ncbi:hypothetical protein O181_006260 [Austropuccinia psidii MF-1]|uniref:Uncharacterized protein n=1 Tax=Austropuccinia psidii MF-1 TaxID=1389203 RepID=A0A9Q3BKM7_9BASI|nr:hypothetical protein [Austropuccinia psidii MF-1]
MQGQEDMSDAERLHQNMLEIQQESIEMLKKEGKRKESIFSLGKIQMEETKTIQRIFRKQGSPFLYSRPMALSTAFTSQRSNTLSKTVYIHAKASSPLQQTISSNITTILKIRPKDYKLWFDGKEV